MMPPAVLLVGGSTYEDRRQQNYDHHPWVPPDSGERSWGRPAPVEAEMKKWLTYGGTIPWTHSSASIAVLKMMISFASTQCRSHKLMKIYNTSRFQLQTEHRRSALREACAAGNCWHQRAGYCSNPADCLQTPDWCSCDFWRQWLLNRLKLSLFY
jgi:hypothetical protein